MIDAVAGHAEFLNVPRETEMAKTLYAVDELSGFIAACALVRPTGIEGMKPKSVKKKLKQPSFAAAVDRDQVQRGIDELGVDPDEHMALIIEALAERADELGIGLARTRRALDEEVAVRRWVKVLLVVLVALIVLLVLNAIAVTNETKDAERQRRGRRAGRDLERHPAGARRGRPRGLADRAASTATRSRCTGSRSWRRCCGQDHRVIRVDLLGHGGSDKPGAGYEIADQASAIAEALAKLDVAGATVVGHSLGGIGGDRARRAEPRPGHAGRDPRPGARTTATSDLPLHAPSSATAPSSARRCSA